MSDNELFIRCNCHSPEHMAIFDTWDWRDGDSELIISASLTDAHPWWRRVARAFEYVLTGKSRGYQWAEVVVKREDAERIRDYVSGYLTALASGMQLREDSTQIEAEAEGLQPDPKGDAQ